MDDFQLVEVEFDTPAAARQAADVLRGVRRVSTTAVTTGPPSLQQQGAARGAASPFKPGFLIKQAAGDVAGAAGARKQGAGGAAAAEGPSSSAAPAADGGPLETAAAGKEAVMAVFAGAAGVTAAGEAAPVGSKQRKKKKKKGKGGGGVVSGGVGTLAEDARFLSSLSQSFVLPNGATEISFRIRSAALGADAGMPPDAFEVALLDPVTGNSLLSPLVGLDLSDALLNLQADGTLYLAPGVTVVGSPLTGTATVTVSLAGVDRSK